jgi:hypothetical protein
VCELAERDADSLGWRQVGGHYELIVGLRAQDRVRVAFERAGLNALTSTEAPRSPSWNELPAPMQQRPRDCATGVEALCRR